MRILKFTAIFLLMSNLAWGGINFDGTDDSVDGSGSLLTAVPITIAAWIYPANTNANKVAVWLGDNGGAQWNAFYIIPSNNAKLSAVSANNNVFSGADSTSIYSANTWYHICGVFASSMSRTIYFNGVNEVTNTTSSTPVGIDSFFIGKHGVTGGGSLMNGQITEVAIWNVALTDAEVALLASSRIKGIPLQVRPANLKLYYPMDDQSQGTSADGTTIRDYSGSGNNGLGNNGANNTGCLFAGESALSYPPSIIGD